MRPVVKLIVCVVLVASASIFGYLAVRNYDKLMDERVGSDAADLTVVKVPTGQPSGSGSNRFSRVILFGAGFVVSVLGLGLLVGHEFSQLVAARFGRLLYHDEGETIKVTEYEQAEAVWADGKPLEAIQMMRSYLEQNPREIHVAIRIAEIYEKDLQNPLAAALEYEEVLRHKVPADQWGWIAIHLCNLYHKLNKPDQATALLRRIVEEYGETPAAVKARKRLGLEEAPEGEAAPAAAQAPPAAEAEEEEEFISFDRMAQKAGKLRSDALQAHFEKFHRPDPPSPSDEK